MHALYTWPMTAAVTGIPKVFLRLDGLVLFLGSAYLCKTIGLSWWLFAALLLVPDIFMVGYLANRTLGAYLYNVGHSYLAPALLLWVGHLQSSQQAIAVAVIWFAHIGRIALPVTG